NILTADGQRAAINGPEGQKALQFLYDMYHVHKVVPASVITTQEDILFKSGVVAALFPIPVRDMLAISQEVPSIDWIAAPPPGDQAQVTAGGGPILVMFKQAKHKEAAYKWMKFL